MEINKKLPEFYKEYKAKEDETIYEHTADLLKNLEELRKIIDIEDIDLIEEACIYHDIGKVNPLFQKRLESKKKFDDSKEIGHNILSFYLSKQFLEKYDKEDKNVILYAILNHHNYVDNFESISEKKELISDNLKIIAKEVFGNIETDFSKSIGLRELALIRNLRSKPSKKSILVKGFLHKCDYAASAHSKTELPNIYLESRLEKFRKEFRSKGLSNGWNNMQKFAKDNTDNNIILIGSTGLGKTEASLLWIGNNKGFYVLPLKTAINAMYRRIKNNFFPDDYNENLGLLHGELENIYLEDSSDNQSSKAENTETEESMKFWEYYGLTRAMSLPLTISTPDQIFRFAFKYCSYELQLATYSYSKIVIDEIQAYSPDILATLIYALQLIDMVGGKFAITTATLPPFIKDLLQEGIEKKIEYKEAEFLNDKIRHRVKLNHKRVDVEEIEKKDFDTYIKKTTEHLGSIVAGKKFSLVLGAGVSCSEGALGWKGLIANFESELNSKCKINTDQVLNKIGNSDLISAQLYRELLTESSYYEIIFRSIYNRYKVPDAKYDTLTNCIARLIKECSEARDFRVMTYNYDNYLEQYLDYYCVAYDIMFDMSNIQIGNMPIYHVHGYLPMIDCKENTEQIKFDYSKYKGIYANSIKLTEDDYNTMYNDAYAWQIGTQLSFFRENKCLFIGCSLTDPNIRRLMRMAEKERKKHFAIINKGGMNLIDLVIATNHFSRMGVEVIWTSSHDECKNIIKDLNKLHSKD